MPINTKTTSPIAAKLNASEGAIHTDGYAVYDAVATKHGLNHGECLSHVRREFTDLGSTCPQVTLPILQFIQYTYRIETQTRKTCAPPTCRELIRRAAASPSPTHSINSFSITFPQVTSEKP